ncbi:MAG: hypothetical protein NVS3B25_09670 [Hymenobacter sp.]
MGVDRAYISQEALFAFLASPRTTREVATHFGTTINCARVRMQKFSRYIVRDGRGPWSLKAGA